VRVARKVREKYAACLPGPLVKRALDDARELAEETGFPLLFFPELAEEKVRILSLFAGRCARKSNHHQQYEPAA
jgi:hypothetical protein